MLHRLPSTLDAAFPGAADAMAALWADDGPWRALLAALAALLVTLLLGPWFIRRVAANLLEPNKSDSRHLRLLHEPKHQTPTMGGLLVIWAIGLAVILFGQLGHPLLQAGLVVMIGLAGVGAVDDVLKLRRSAGGLPARGKLLAQTAVAAVAAAIITQYHARVPGGLALDLPAVGVSFSLGIWYLPLAAVAIVGFSNAVNLTDGLDGLASGCLIPAAVALFGAAYAVSQALGGTHPQLEYAAGCHAMLVPAASMVGGVLGFLRVNRHPARIFMGDTGSLPLGGLLAVIALAIRQEALLVVVGGVFVAEAASVILQVGYYKWRRRRILLCAPLHHHFEFLGWPETHIVRRFWIAAAFCALVGLTGWKAGLIRQGSGPEIGWRTVQNAQDAVGHARSTDLQVRP